MTRRYDDLNARAEAGTKFGEIVATVCAGLLFWLGLYGAAMVGDYLQQERLEADRAAAVEAFGANRE